jgi:hypothetical protein
MLRYARFHLGDGCAEDGTRILSDASMRAMQSSQVEISDGRAWGLTWALEDSGGLLTVSHGGGTVGQISLFTLAPERDFAVVILTNANRGGEVTGQGTRWALNHFLGAERDDPEPIQATEEELAQYAGWYRRPFADIELGMLGGRLVGQMIFKQGFPTQDQPPGPPPPPIVLGLCAKDRLIVLDGPAAGDTAEVVRRADGSIGWLRFGRLFCRDD